MKILIQHKMNCQSEHEWATLETIEAEAPYQQDVSESIPEAIFANVGMYPGDSLRVWVAHDWDDAKPGDPIATCKNCGFLWNTARSTKPISLCEPDQ